MLRALFKKNNEVETYSPEIPLDSLNNPLTHHIWLQRNHYGRVNEGGLKHRFYTTVYNLIGPNEQKMEQGRYNHAIRSEALYALNRAGNREFSDAKEFESWLEENVNLATSTSLGITLYDVAEYALEHSEDVKNDEYLHMWR